MLIKNENVRYVNMNKTFCVNNGNCKLRDKCDRSYFKLLADGVVFPIQVSMKDFYQQNAECKYFIKEDLNG